MIERSDTPNLPEATQTADVEKEPSFQRLVPFREGPVVPLPTSQVSSTVYPAPFRVLVPDEGSIVKLLEDLLDASGMSVKQAARNFGVADMSLRQYLRGRRSNPSTMWLIKFANLCGFELVIRRKKQ